jgi:virginiamycin B lyase
VIGLLVAALAATAATAVAAPAPEARTVSVTPNVGLVDGDAVTVSGAGWPPGEQLSIFQCAKPGGNYDCRRMLPRPGYVVVAANGTFSAAARVRSVFEGDDGPVDCRIVECVLAVDYVLRFDRPSESAGERRPPLELAPATPEGGDFPLAETALDFAPAGPLLPPATLTATPDSGLVDGQSIDVTGSGFTPGATVSLYLCPAAPSSLADCDFSGPFPVATTADGSGAISATVAVFTVLWGFDAGGRDCRTEACRLLAFDGDLPGDPRGETPLAFDPAGPLPPRPEVSVSPSTDLVDRQAVHIHGTGFRPHAEVWVDQCRDDGSNDPWDCRYTDGFGEADEDGVLDADFTVRESFRGDRGQIHCSRAPCIVTVLDFQGDPLFKLPLTFQAPVGPSLAESCDLVHFNPRDLFIGAVAGGPDGRVWFEATGDDKRARLGAITHDGTITTYLVGPNVSGIGDLTAGSDGNIWFTAEGWVWKSTPSGTITQVAHPGSAGPIISGADGALWFGMVDGVGRVATDGTLTEFTAAAVGDRPDDLMVGPDGEVWYVTNGDLRRISATGAVTVVATQVTEFGVDGLATASDGDVWTSLEYDNRIGRISPAGEVTRFGEPHQYKEPVGMVRAADGALWFVTAQGNQLGRVGADEAIDLFVDRGGRLLEPRAITLGPDGHLWLSAQGSGLARVDRCALGAPVSAAPGFTG